MNKNIISLLLIGAGVYTYNRFYYFSKIKPLFKYLGTMYKWGGCDPHGFDCSGLIYYYYKIHLNRSIKRKAIDQYNQAKKINPLFARPGDLIFFDTDLNGQINHVGIYLGSNMFIHAGTSTNVSIQNLKSDYWAKRYRSIGRI